MGKIIHYAIISLLVLLSTFFTGFARAAQHRVLFQIPACGK